MIREVKEEIGLVVLEFKLLNIYSGPNHHNIYPNGDEVLNVQWFNISTL